MTFNLHLKNFFLRINLLVFINKTFKGFLLKIRKTLNNITTFTYGDPFIRKTNDLNSRSRSALKIPSISRELKGKKLFTLPWLCVME